jgi:WD40 repeat protein
MKHFYLALLALVFCVVIALGYVSQGLTAEINKGKESVAHSPRGNAAEQYKVTGDRSGKVTVQDAVSGKVIRTFEMDEGVVVRETFLLDGGKTVAASQKDRAVFWDLATGREIRRFPQRIYGFSHDESRFFTYKRPGMTSLYAYPKLTFVCQLAQWTDGPRMFIFSPDDRFLNIQFATGFPARDEYYPHGEPTRSSLLRARLFYLPNCQEVKIFSELRPWKIGEFSADSRFLYLKDEWLLFDGQRLRGSWRFNLTNYTIEKISD